MYIGKILEIYAYKNGHHEWQTTASSRDKISYLALMVYYYDPGAVVLTSYQHGVSHRLTFSLCECANVHYVFPKTSAHDLKDLEGENGAIFLPLNVRPMLTIMGKSEYITHVEADLATQKTKK